MTKGDDTRQMILHRAAEVFNLRGYFGTSMSDIMAATGLEKGGIYNHFKSKDDLALQAFDYAVDLIRREFRSAVRERPDAIDRLHAVLAVYERVGGGQPIAGGCPVSNTAHEADHTHPALRLRAEAAMQEWHDFFRWILIRGQRRGDIRLDVNVDSTATFFIATLEGAVMLSQLHGDTVYMDRAITHLQHTIEQLR
jgi:TetR/AcrR family transcriptional regulator, transcriptional repressor for nem operon